MDNSLFTQDGLVGLIFLIVVGVTLFGGLVTCMAQTLIRALSGLALTSAGIGGIYFFLNSPFVSMMQILIYVGAVAVTISFGIMLAPPEGTKMLKPFRTLAGPVGFGVSALLAGGLAILAVNTRWEALPKTNDGSMYTIGIQLLTNHSMVFELISIVLLVSILGALVIAREGRG